MLSTRCSAASGSLPHEDEQSRRPTRLSAPLNGRRSGQNHLLQPVILSCTVQLSALTVTIAIFLGVELLGFLGALLAIPVAGILHVIGRDLYDGYRGQLKTELSASDLDRRSASWPPPWESMKGTRTAGHSVRPRSVLSRRRLRFSILSEIPQWKGLSRTDSQVRKYEVSLSFR